MKQNFEDYCLNAVMAILAIIMVCAGVLCVWSTYHLIKGDWNDTSQPQTVVYWATNIDTYAFPFVALYTAENSNATTVVTNRERTVTNE